MNSSILKLDIKDITQALAMAVAIAILGGLQQMLGSHGFDFASYDWGLIGNLVVGAILSSLSISLGTTTEGKVLGVAKVK